MGKCPALVGKYLDVSYSVGTEKVRLRSRRAVVGTVGKVGTKYIYLEII